MPITQSQRDWYQKNRDAQLEKKKADYRANKEHYKALAKARIAKPGVKEEKFRTMIRFHYGDEAARTVTYPKPELCQICGRKSKDYRGLHFEHCHKTGKFRGWACDRCNHAIAKCEDDPKILRALANYLESFLSTVA